MLLDHTWLLAHIPHQGSMCLLDQVDEWSSEFIRCRASSHRDLNNPLRLQGRLASVCGIEYAAQAMAAHGALLSTANTSPLYGYLTSVRNVNLHVGQLDNISTDLHVEAKRISGDENIILYSFSLVASEQLLLEGRATVILDAAKLELVQCQ